MKLRYNSKVHGYWLDGKRLKSPSSIAKVPDDQTSLNRWKLRQALTGVALRPELATRIAAANGDKDTLDLICEEAIHAAGGNAGRDRGTAVHAIVDGLDNGAVLLETPEVVAIRDQWRALLDRYCLEVVRTEGVVVHPDLGVAGRFDQIVRCPDGRLRIGDIKTGADANKYLHAHAVQLWLYASAPYIAEGPRGDADFEITEFAPMPDVDQEVGYVFHLPAEGMPEVIGVDLAAGKACFHEVITPVWKWRAKRDLRVEVEPVGRPVLRQPSPATVATTTPTVTPDEGGAADVTELRTRYMALPAVGRAWVEAKRNEAVAAGCDFHLAGHFTERRASIMSGLLALASNEADDDDAVRALVRFATTDDACEWLSVPAGAAVGSMSAAEAGVFAATCALFVGGVAQLHVDDDGARVVVGK